MKRKTSTKPQSAGKPKNSQVNKNVRPNKVAKSSSSFCLKFIGSFLVLFIAACVGFLFFPFNAPDSDKVFVQLDPSVFAKDYSFQLHYVKLSNGISLQLIDESPANSPRPFTGPTLVLLHGFPQSNKMWRNVIRSFVGQGWRVVAPNMRGYNGSSSPSEVDAYSIAQHVNDVQLLLKEHVGAPKVPVVLGGHDWGGAIAWAFAAQHGDLLTKFFSINAPHPMAMKDNMLGKQFLRSWYMLFLGLPPFHLPEWKIVRENYDWLTYFGLGSAKTGTFSKNEIAEYRAMWERSLTPMINYYRQGVREMLFEPVQSIGAALGIIPAKPRASLVVNVDSLLVWGVDDKYLGKELADSSRLYSAGLQVEYLPGSHWVIDESPAEVINLLQMFVADVKIPAAKDTVTKEQKVEGQQDGKDERKRADNQHKEKNKKSEAEKKQVEDKLKQAEEQKKLLEQEAARKQQEEEQRLREETERRKLLEQEAARRQQEEEQRLREETERRKKEEAARKQQEEELLFREETARRKKEEEQHLKEQKKLLEQDAARRKQEEEQRVQEEAARKQTEKEQRVQEEAARKQREEEQRVQEEAARKQREEEQRVQEEATRKQREEEQRVQEEAARKQKEEEAATKQKKEEQRVQEGAARRKQEEENRAREEAALRQQEEAERIRQDEEQRLKEKEALRRKQEEEEQHQKEAETRKEEDRKEQQKGELEKEKSELAEKLKQEALRKHEERKKADNPPQIPTPVNKNAEKVSQPKKKTKKE